MIEAELKRLHSPDVFDLRAFRPPDPERFAFLLQVMVGPRGGEGEESFDVEVCTPQWLMDNPSQSSVLLGWPRLIVYRYDIDEIEKVIRRFCSSCRAETWREVALQVGRLGRWEFDDYQPYENRST